MKDAPKLAEDLISDILDPLDLELTEFEYKMLIACFIGYVRGYRDILRHL